MNFRNSEQQALVEKAWRDTPYSGEGALVTVVYRTEPKPPGVISAECTLVLIGGHVISLVDYMAVELGFGHVLPSVLLVHASGFALRLPLGAVRVEPIGSDLEALAAEYAGMPVPPEWTAWQDAQRAHQAAMKPTTKISDWARATTRIEDFIAPAALDDAPASPTLTSP